MGGSNLANQTGTYGTEGTASTTNILGAREFASSWVDAAGNFWLFGGVGVNAAGSNGNLNDVWEFSGGEWKWAGGSKYSDQTGTYGTKGTPSLSNTPGVREQAARWTDASGNLWLFGGYGLDSAGTSGYLNDLWKYSNGQWTWISGSNLANQPGIYPADSPGGRSGSSTWIDAGGNLWLFGGVGYDSTGATSELNDLWEFNPTTKDWTWVSGSKTINAPGVYGTEGIASTSNTPGARTGATSWTDASGNFWLFGGLGYSATGAGSLNDLWKYSSGQWTWVGGSNGYDAPGVYGTQGTPSANNIPGARVSAAVWYDKSGNLWLFGGDGYDSSGTTLSSPGELNDLWKYSNGQWTWVGGSKTFQSYTPGSYGTLGTASPSNLPGGREGAATWIDGSGNLWLFGGDGYDSTGSAGSLNDIWMFTP